VVPAALHQSGMARRKTSTTAEQMRLLRIDCDGQRLSRSALISSFS